MTDTATTGEPVVLTAANAAPPLPAPKPTLYDGLAHDAAGIYKAATKMDPQLPSDVRGLLKGKVPRARALYHGAAAFGAAVLSSSAALGTLGHFGAGRTLITAGIVGAVVALLHQWA